MAGSFDLRVIAEGVENEEQMMNLIDLGCDEVQGFMLGPSWPRRAARRLLRSELYRARRVVLAAALGFFGSLTTAHPEM